MENSETVRQFKTPNYSLAMHWAKARKVKEGKENTVSVNLLTNMMRSEARP
jgi:hypothetical protein